MTPWTRYRTLSSGKSTLRMACGFLTSMHNEAVIREARFEDLGRLVELYASLARDPSAEDASTPVREEYERAFRAALADERQRTFVVERDGRVVASAVLIVVPNVTHLGRPFAIAENVVVDEGMRGQGIGGELMRRLIDEARSAGCYKLSLTSHVSREDAHRFYEGLGFLHSHKGFRVDFG